MLTRLSRPLIPLLTVALATVAAASPVPAQHATLSGITQVAASTAVGQPQAQARFERWATLQKTSYGYYYDAGQQNTHLTITRVNGGVRYADTRTDVLRYKPDSCRRLQARVGIVVFCRVSRAVSPRHPITLRVFTRLGNDYVDGSRLPASFKMYMLADWGSDTIRTGAGNDFVNGAKGDDWVAGGAGNDWIRTGPGNDRLWGGRGNDRLVGVEGWDQVHGRQGNDRVGGGDGNDLLFAGEGKDFVLCGTGRDHAQAKRADRIMRDCERVRFG